GQDESGGTWFEFLELVSVDGQQINFAATSENSASPDAFEVDGIESLEEDIEQELLELGA
ncbi:MAG: hypothetical protein F6K24_10205, partial [Okeania sp. SIO2D1]|nr:hypothetical protein [Okeania sp. SIO2D1]